MKFLLIFFALFSQGAFSKIAQEGEETEMKNVVFDSLHHSEFCCDREIKTGDAHELSPQQIHHLLHGTSSGKPLDSSDSPGDR